MPEDRLKRQPPHPRPLLRRPSYGRIYSRRQSPHLTPRWQLWLVRESWWWLALWWL